MEAKVLQFRLRHKGDYTLWEKIGVHQQLEVYERYSARTIAITIFMENPTVDEIRWDFDKGGSGNYLTREGAKDAIHTALMQAAGFYASDTIKDRVMQDVTRATIAAHTKATVTFVALQYEEDEVRSVWFTESELRVGWAQDISTSDVVWCSAEGFYPEFYEQVV